MTIALTVNGVTFAYPETNDVEWGYEATQWANAVTNGMLQKAGGNFTLASDVNFGATYGLISTYFKSRSADISTSGVLRLANTDTVCWRNNANSGNLCLSVGADDMVDFNGINLVDVSTPQTVSNKTLVNATFSFPSNPYSSVTTDASGVLTFQTGLTDQVLQATATNPQFNRYLQANVYKAAPTPSGVTADLWYNTSVNRYRMYTGSSYVPLAAESLNELDDVTLSSPATNQVLLYNGSQWVNNLPVLQLGQLSDVNLTGLASTQLVQWNGSQWVNVNPSAVAGSISLNDLSDVAITSVSANQVLYYDGAQWINAPYSNLVDAYVQTTNTTPTAIKSVSIPNGTAMTFHILLNGFNPANGDTMAMILKGALKRYGGTSSFVGGSYQEELFEDTGAASWDAYVQADDPNDELDLIVVGQAATTINWTATIQYTMKR